MVIRNCLQLLLELSRLEEKIAAVQGLTPDSERDEEIVKRLVEKLQRCS